MCSPSILLIRQRDQTGRCCHKPVRVDSSDTADQETDDWPFLRMTFAITNLGRPQTHGPKTNGNLLARILSSMHHCECAKMHRMQISRLGRPCQSATIDLWLEIRACLLI